VPENSPSQPLCNSLLTLRGAAPGSGVQSPPVAPSCLETYAVPTGMPFRRQVLLAMLRGYQWRVKDIFPLVVAGIGTV